MRLPQALRDIQRESEIKMYENVIIELEASMVRSASKGFPESYFSSFDFITPSNGEFRKIPFMFIEKVKQHLKDAGYYVDVINSDLDGKALLYAVSWQEELQ